MADKISAKERWENKQALKLSNVQRQKEWTETKTLEQKLAHAFEKQKKGLNCVKETTKYEKREKK